MAAIRNARLRPFSTKFATAATCVLPSQSQVNGISRIQVRLKALSHSLRLVVWRCDKVRAICVIRQALQTFPFYLLEERVFCRSDEAEAFLSSFRRVLISFVGHPRKALRTRGISPAPPAQRVQARDAAVVADLCNHLFALWARLPLRGGSWKEHTMIASICYNSLRLRMRSRGKVAATLRDSIDVNHKSARYARYKTMWAVIERLACQNRSRTSKRKRHVHGIDTH